MLSKQRSLSRQICWQVTAMWQGFRGVWEVEGVKCPLSPFSAFPTGSFRGISEGAGYLLASGCHSTPQQSRWKPGLPEEDRLPTLIKLTLATICYSSQYKTRISSAMKALSEAPCNLTEHTQQIHHWLRASVAKTICPTNWLRFPSLPFFYQSSWLKVSNRPQGLATFSCKILSVCNLQRVEMPG